MEYENYDNDEEEDEEDNSEEEFRSDVIDFMKSVKIFMWVIYGALLIWLFRA